MSGEIVSKRNFVLVYSGEGASQRSILSTIEALKSNLHGTQVRQLCSLELLDGQWQEDCALLVFPGGADLPYCQTLNGPGNFLIKEYVANGGAYLGICAGAYYACEQVEFELGTPLEVRGERELAFFPGVARGAVQPGFDYNTEAGTAAIPIRFQDARTSGDWQECRDYSNGGPSFITAGESDDVQVLAEYCREDIEGAAAVQCRVGSGVAVLCGTHPELGFKWLDRQCQAEYMQRCHPKKSQEEISTLVREASKVRLLLLEDHDQREEFWRSLLVAAGMKEHIRWSKTSLELERLNAKKESILLNAAVALPVPS